MAIKGKNTPDMAQIIGLFPHYIEFNIPHLFSGIKCLLR